MRAHTYMHTQERRRKKEKKKKKAILVSYLLEASRWVLYHTGKDRESKPALAPGHKVLCGVMRNL